MRTATSETTRRRIAAKKTVEVTEQRLRAAKTAKDRDELTGLLDRARQALKSAERDVALERAGVEFRERLRRVNEELEVERG